ncbi:hypothetical protein KR222_003983 [Zaprionus bogoriensis]|nr:hypothetical protein KR222_003983 [Zaprionus bogoriensis]
MLLQANGYVSLVWGISYLLHMLVWVSAHFSLYSCFATHTHCQLEQLWNYRGLAMLLAFVLAMAAEALRLYAGYSINLRTGATSMWLLLALTPCVLLPALVYLRLAAISGQFWLQLGSNVQLALMALEALVTLVYHVLSASRGQAGSQATLKFLELQKGV